ncbi:MAG: amino acid/amide transporter ATP-binding protein 2, family [Deltaproteobacteria bacterium]|jgi:branched-chain amino acid transport system ATP-binding protein|nr:amino acid/amide transporter ATP-binding protein 2, family [Deltaproteobacteria bacterium]
MLLKVQDIETWYGSAQALKGVSLKVESGELISILGANGAGKTTLLRTISGLIEPKKGTIEFEGRRIDRMGAEEIVRLGVSHCPEGRKLFPQMTVHKNLLLGGYVRKTDQRGIRDTLEEVFSLFPVLKDRQEQLAGTLSGGEQQMLVISRGLMSRPKLLMLDEPSLGIAPLLVARIFEVIKDINRRGMTILLVEQNAAVALNIANHGYVLETGEIVLSGGAQELLREEKVREAYLGV